MNKRPLAPKFLNKLDNNLLLNRPDTWSTRFHLVFYYGFLFMITLALICYVSPTDHREESYYGLWSGATGVLSLIGFIVWLVYLLRFNVFKHFGTVFPGDRLKTFLLYYFIITMMVVVVYIPPVVECFRADQAYSTRELSKDIDSMNELVAKLEYENIPKEWTPDTLLVTKINANGVTELPNNANYNYSHVDSSDFHYRLSIADSSVRLNDSMAVIYTFFNLIFIENSRMNNYSSKPLKNNLDLYYSVFKNHKPANSVAVRKELQILLLKYKCTKYNIYDDYNDDLGSYDLSRTIEAKYDLSSVNRGLNNIASRKYRLLSTDISDFVRATYYITLVLTLLVFIFRHSTIKTFFLSILVGIVLAILSGLSIAILGLQENGIFFLLNFYYVIFAIVALMSFKSKKRYIVQGIALNIFVFMTVFIPLVCTAWYHEIVRKNYYAYGGNDYYSHSNESTHIFIAEIAGAVILWILIETLFKRLYRAWYASPEE